METPTKASMKRESRTAMDSTIGRTAQNILGILWVVCVRERAYGQIIAVIAMKGSLRATKRTAKAFLLGRTETDMRAPS
jgi:hypothetical protein